MTTTTTERNGTTVTTTHGPAGTRVRLSHISPWTSGVSVRAGGFSVEVASDLRGYGDDETVALPALVQGF